MSNFGILIDSTGDLPKSLREPYDIGYCPMNVSWGGKDVKASLDWDQGFTPHEFYDIMRKGTRIYTTQVPASVFQKEFEALLSKGLDVLYISCSSALSGSINTARKEAEKLEKKYPGRKVYCLDSLISGFAQGAMAIKARELQREGKSLDEVAAYIEKTKLKYNQFGAVDDLSYLKRAGRVSSSAAFFGNLFGVKPIVISDAKGHNYAFKKIKGRKASLTGIAQMAYDACEDPANSTIYIGHDDDPEGAEFVKEELKKIGPVKEIFVGDIGPIVGASTGPGTVCTYCYGKEVTVVGE